MLFHRLRTGEQKGKARISSTSSVSPSPAPTAGAASSANNGVLVISLATLGAGIGGLCVFFILFYYCCIKKVNKDKIILMINEAKMDAEVLEDEEEEEIELEDDNFSDDD